MSASPLPGSMPPEDRRLIHDFLTEVLAKSEELDGATARARADDLLRDMLSLDERALNRASELCRTAGGWSEVWYRCSLRVRHAISRYYSISAPGTAAHELSPYAPAATAPPRRFCPPGDLERQVREETAKLAVLDAWILSGCGPLAEFFALWEPARGADDDL